MADSIVTFSIIKQLKHVLKYPDKIVIEHFRSFERKLLAAGFELGLW